jgi:DNA polymerase-3 subunit epsilon
MKIAFFDLETTGTNITKDRIVAIAIQVVNFRTREVDALETKINPEVPIPVEATEIHGITNEDVKDSPKFREISDDVVSLFSSHAIAGHNIRKFDIPVLLEELNRCAKTIDLAQRPIIDTLEIERKLNGHDLSSVFKRRYGSEMIGAHDAASDVSATVEIFKSQFQELNTGNEILTLEQIEQKVSGEKTADAAGYLRFEDDKIFFNFGKHKGKEATAEPDYITWMLNADFPADTKKILRQLKK